MGRYDIAIIGTGPAGLEAAITAKLRNKSILLLGSKTFSPKVEKAHTIQNYLGLPEASGPMLQSAFQKHIRQLDISITEDRVNTVYAMEDVFAIQGHRDMYEADAVILACGMSVQKPFPGEMENLGRGVSYCATCDGALFRGKSVLVLGYSREDEEEADFLSELAGEVTYLPMYPEAHAWNPKVSVKTGAVPEGIARSDKKMVLSLQDQTTLTADGIFILRTNIAPSQLVPGLKMDGNHVAVDRSCRTNIPGLFACGDITGTPYQYIKAAGEGNVAALSAASYLAEKRSAAK